MPRLSPTLVLALSCGPLDRRGSEAGCPSSEAAVALTNKSGAPNRVEDAHALADPLNNLLSCLRAELASPHGVLRNPDRTPRLRPILAHPEHASSVSTLAPTHHRGYERARERCIAEVNLDGVIQHRPRIPDGVIAHPSAPSWRPRPGPAMFASCVAAPASPPTSARSSSSFRSHRTGRPWTSRRAGTRLRGRQSLFPRRHKPRYYDCARAQNLRRSCA